MEGCKQGWDHTPAWKYGIEPLYGGLGASPCMEGWEQAPGWRAGNYGLYHHVKFRKCPFHHVVFKG